MASITNGPGSQQYQYSGAQILGDRGQVLDVYQSAYTPNYLVTIHNTGLDYGYSTVQYEQPAIPEPGYLWLLFPLMIVLLVINRRVGRCL